MDTKYLESFAAVVEHGSIAEAARRMSLTPAGVAQRVRALESDLGVSLLRRVGRRVLPTEAGVAVHARSRDVLQGIRDLRQATSPDSISGELRLGAISTSLTGILPGLLKAAIPGYPHLSIHVSPGTSMDLCDRVVAGDLDAAIVVEPPFRLPKSCDWREIRRESQLLIAAAGVDISDPAAALQREPFIRYDRNHWGGRLADRYLHSLGIAPRERFELDALEAIAVMVDRGLGISIVPDWPQPWPEGLRLQRQKIADDTLARSIGLVWTRGGRNLRLIEAFLALAIRRPAHFDHAGALEDCTA